MIIVAFDFRTKCAVTDRIETAYKLTTYSFCFSNQMLRACKGWKYMHIFKTREYGPGGGGGGGGGGGDSIP